MHTTTTANDSNNNKHALLEGHKLENAAGKTVHGDVATRGKQIAFYFAADWCPDCRDFQPTLNEFYKNVNAEKQLLEIVFVGSDASAEDQQAHFRDKQGPWWAVPFTSDLRNELKRKYGVCLRREQEEVGVTTIRAGIPALVLAEQNGDELMLLTDVELSDPNGLAIVSQQLQQRAE